MTTQHRSAPRADLLDLFKKAVAAVSAADCVPAHLPAPPPGRTVVIGAGKGAAAMAQAVDAHWRGDLSGLVVTRYGHGAPTRRIEVVEAAHPVPDAAGAAAAQRIMALAGSLEQDDLLLCLISGGGSSLLAAPAQGLAFGDKQAINRALLRSGASISEMNCVRKHLSAIKGGRLAAACRGRVHTLLISDIPGDDPSHVASGPTIPDATTCEDALRIIARYGIEVPDAVRSRLVSGELETPKPGDPRFAGHRHEVVATAMTALEAAADRARALGIEPQILSDHIEGEARDVATAHADIVREMHGQVKASGKPRVLLSGGETTVTVRGKGRGGRNAEFLLALAVALEGMPDVHAIACDTDGIDGSEDNAGAVIGPDTLARAAASGIDAQAMLADNNGYGFFSALGDLVVTGPTLTNVNDFRAVLVL
ncbi:glycerate kinase [Noviherbaspirillum sp. CPCC 100848]|uniref:Glycerate kinase n=1 Tax=Noviherbaspirillum album TaxID=3080276 RepID=A0ABU6J908_9BURK|nr:glycerate kinase [Noviherbaspirillum sp. CPCC 100848]MEC4720128.1 glycerate kinase [Noviherbaspirillum sp. CPCC 100848]